MTLVDSYGKTLLDFLQSPTLLRATLSGPQRLQKSPLTRITLRPIQLHNTPHLQISRFDARQDHTQNILPENLPAVLADILAIGFANIHITTTTEELDLRLTKKLELTISRKNRTTQTPSTPTAHNRTKLVPLPEGQSDRLLQLLNIMTKDGNIRPTMRPKFTQINEFLKLLDPLLAQLPPSEKPLTILDAGSGSAYLTFATHHYLTHIKKIPAQILGIDLNDTLIAKSIDRAKQMNNEQSTMNNTLHFQSAKIANASDLHPDIVLALHACDTATDDALALAIRAHAKIILAVPCCHKNLNAQLQILALAPLHRHGILHERFADLLTDSFRALILRIMGYKTDVIEFISPEHTARNLMIRAIHSTPPVDPKFLAEYQALKQFTNVTPHLEKILAPEFQKHLAP